jgi:hypothetical protein
MPLQFSTSIDLLTLTQPAESSAGVTGNTTGSMVDVSLRSQQTVQYYTGSGTGTFSIDGSNDGKNWVTSIATQDLTSTASATFITSVANLAAGSSRLVKIPSGIRYIRGVVVGSTNGVYSAFLEATG